MLSIAEQIVNSSKTYESHTEEMVKMTLLDTISAMIMGMHEPELICLINELKQWSHGEYAIVGNTNQFALMDAAFIMGTASVAVELDEGNQWSKGHPSVHIVPIFLIHAAIDKTYTGKQFINDFITSYEITTHFGKITSLKQDLHAHGTWGVLGSAATFGVIHQIDAVKLADLLNVAATFATPTQWTSALEGAHIRNVYIAESIVGGIRAWQLVNAGYKAPNGNAERIFNNILGDQFAIDVPYRENIPAVEKSYFKFHAFCRYVHVPLEVFRYLIVEHNILLASIVSVKVTTYARAATLKTKNPKNSLSSKFSIPFALAAWTYTGRTDHGIFAERIFESEEVKKLAEKITVLHDTSFDENYPNVMPAEVKITLNTGEVFSHIQQFALGGPDEKTNFNELKNKFSVNTAKFLTEKAQHEIIQFIKTLEQRDSFYELVEIINNGLKEVK